MSVEEKQKKLEEINTEIQEKSKVLADLKVDIQSRQKLLETLNSIEKTGNNQAVVESLKKQDEEIANKDKEIAALKEKIEALQKAEEAQAAKNKENKAKENNELIQSYENQKVKYVEEIQNMTIELKKKDRVFQEKCKEYDEKIEGLEKIVEGLKEDNTDLTKEIEQLKEKLAEVTKKNEEFEEEKKYLQEKIKGLASENDTLMGTNEDLKKVLDERDATTKKLGQQLAGKEEQIKRMGAGSNQAIEEQEKVLSEKEELIREKEEALIGKEKEILKLEKDLEAQNLEIEKIAKEMNNLKKEKEEDHHKIEKLNGDIEALKKKFEEALEEKQKAAESQAAPQEKEEEEEEVVVKPEPEEVKEEKAHKHENEDEPEMKRKHGEKPEEEESPKAIQRKTFNGDFEDRLKSIQEESHREVVKLTRLLESAEAENQEKLLALEDKERRLIELEEMNDTFEGLVQGLKKTILEVQDKMERNTKYLIELEKKLAAKDAELFKLREFENNITFLLRDKENQLSANKLELSNKDAQILKLEKSLFSIIEELNLFKVKLKQSNDKVNLLTRSQNKAHLTEISSKENEIAILKEMIKSTQGVIRTKDLEINRLKSKVSYEVSPVKLPPIGNGSYGGSDAFKMMGKKDPKLANMFRLSEKRTLESEQNYSLREYPLKPFMQAGSGYENLLSHAASHEKEFGDEIAQNFKELYSAKGTLEDQEEENNNKYVQKEQRMLSQRSTRNNNKKQQVEQEEDEIAETGRKRDTKEDNQSSGNLSLVDTEAKKKKHTNSIFDPSGGNADNATNIMTPVKVKSKHSTKKSIAEPVEGTNETVTTES